MGTNEGSAVRAVCPHGRDGSPTRLEEPGDDYSMTACCGAAVTFSDMLGAGPVLCCKCCWAEVAFGGQAYLVDHG